MGRDSEQARQGLTDEEIEALMPTDLPDREALSVINLGLPTPGSPAQIAAVDAEVVGETTEPPEGPDTE